MVWQWRDIHASNFAGKSFNNISSEYRCGNPVGLLTHSMAGPEVVVVNLLAPLHQVFWSCAQLPACTSLPTLIHDQPETQRAALASGVEAMFKAAKVKIASAQARWFAEYAQAAGKSARSVPSLSEPELSYLEAWRWVHLTVRRERLETLKRLLEAELEQFGELAFWTCDERIQLFSSQTGFASSGDARLKDLGSKSMKLALEMPDAYVRLQESALDELATTIGRLELGIPFDYRLDARALLTGPLVAEMPVNWTLTSRIRQLEQEISASKARLIRLLGWPTHYHWAKDKLQDIEANERWRGVQRPYNLLDELKAYVISMEATYPVLSGKHGR